MNRIKDCLKALALLSLCVLMLGTAWAIRQIPRILDRQADALRGQLEAETLTAVNVADRRLADALVKLDQRSGEALQIVRMTALNADLQTTGVRADVTGQLATLNATLARTLKPVEETAAQVNTALPDFLDCQVDENGIGNKTCLYYRYADLLHSADVTLQAVADAAPAVSKDVEKMAQSSVSLADSAAQTGQEVTKAAKRFNAPQTKKQAFKSWLLLAARIGGAL